MTPAIRAVTRKFSYHKSKTKRWSGFITEERRSTIKIKIKSEVTRVEDAESDERRQSRIT